MHAEKYNPEVSEKGEQKATDYMRPSPTYLNSPRNVSGNATVKGALSSRILLSVSRVATCDQAKRYSLWNTVYTAAEQSEGHPGSCNRIQIPNIFQSKQQWGTSSLTHI